MNTTDLWERAEAADQAARNWKLAAEYWLLQARRSRRAFKLATIAAGLLALIAWWGWLR
jgi:hypothetical protein